MEKADGTETGETIRTAEKASVLEKLHRYQQEAQTAAETVNQEKNLYNGEIKGRGAEPLPEQLILFRYYKIYFLKISFMSIKNDSFKS